MPTLSEIIAWGTSPNVSRIIITILVGYLILLWISLIIWTTKDIISRTNNVIYQLISILLVVVLNIFGLFIYLGIRPAKTLIEKFFEDLEYEALVQGANENSLSRGKSNNKRRSSKTKKEEKRKSKKTNKKSNTKSNRKSK